MDSRRIDMKDVQKGDCYGKDIIMTEEQELIEGVRKVEYQKV